MADSRRRSEASRRCFQLHNQYRRSIVENSDLCPSSRIGQTLGGRLDRPPIPDQPEQPTTLSLLWRELTHFQRSSLRQVSDLGEHLDSPSQNAMAASWDARQSSQEILSAAYECRAFFRPAPLSRSESLLHRQPRGCPRALGGLILSTHLSGSCEPGATF